jgi:lactoylglutathione lyase
MELGAFSVSLAVKDIKVSKAFYEKLGFKDFGDDIAQNWLIMKNGDCVIGLFQGMFDKNLLTFNPGWDQNAQNLEKFTDVRKLQRKLKDQSVALTQEADESTSGRQFDPVRPACVSPCCTSNKMAMRSFFTARFLRTHSCANIL